MNCQKTKHPCLISFPSTNSYAKILVITRNIYSLRGALPHWHRSSTNVIYFWNVKSPLGISYFRFDTCNVSRYNKSYDKIL